ncbi:MAG: hypothetical protein JWO77_501, partial [Ilumatobacteraceae bacterium]|nr:hypothetical protein [Ilumatobacteraceae bacterium]
MRACSISRRTRTERRGGKRAHALLDRVLDVDPATAHGSELTGLMVARAELACVIDGAAVAAMAPWEASA